MHSWVLEFRGSVAGRGVRNSTVLFSYCCILNYYPINSKIILWGNFKVTPLKMNFDEIFWHRSVLQNYPA